MAKIVIASDSDVNDLDPQNFRSDASYAAVENMYDGLFELDVQRGPDRTWRATVGEVVGQIIERHELSEDGTVVTLHVRRGVSFSDGTPCTASSVKFTLDRALLGPGYLPLMMDMLGVESEQQFRQLDDYSLEIHLLHPNPILWDLLPLSSFSVLNPVATKAHATDDDPWGSRWYGNHACGTGPYVLGACAWGEEYAFDPNPLYWRPDQVHNDGVVMRFTPSADDRMDALQRGLADVTFNLEPAHLAECIEDPKLRVLTMASTDCRVMSLNANQPPFNDVKVRQAICHAVPYGQVRAEAMGEYCQPLLSPIPEGMPSHDHTLWKYDFDPQRARGLLSEAGYENGFSTRLTACEIWPDEIRAAKVIQRALQSIGMQVEVVTLSEVEYFARLKEFPMALFETFSWVNDPMYHLLSNLKTGTGKNLANYSNARVDELVDRGMYERDSEVRAAMSREAQRIIVEEAPWVLLYQYNYTVVTRTDVSGYAIYPDMLPRWRFLSRNGDPQDSTRR